MQWLRRPAVSYTNNTPGLTPHPSTWVTVEFNTQSAAITHYNNLHKMGFQTHLYYGAVTYHE
jgi:hypothetical protein